MAVPASAATSIRLGDLLVREGLCTPEHCAGGAEGRRAAWARLCLVKLGYVDGDRARRGCSRASIRMPAVDLSRFEVDPKVAEADPGRAGDEAHRPAAQARRPHAHRRDGRPDATSASSTTSSSSRATTSSRSSPASTRSATRSRSTTSRPTCRWQSLLEDIAAERRRRRGRRGAATRTCRRPRWPPRSTTRRSSS